MEKASKERLKKLDLRCEGKIDVALNQSHLEGNPGIAGDVNLKEDSKMKRDQKAPLLLDNSNQLVEMGGGENTYIPERNEIATTVVKYNIDTLNHGLKLPRNLSLLPRIKSENSFLSSNASKITSNIQQNSPPKSVAQLHTTLTVPGKEKNPRSSSLGKPKIMKKTLRSSHNKEKNMITPSLSKPKDGFKDESLFTSKAASAAWKYLGKPNRNNTTKPNTNGDEDLTGQDSYNRISHYDYSKLGAEKQKFLRDSRGIRTPKHGSASPQNFLKVGIDKYKNNIHSSSHINKGEKNRIYSDFEHVGDLDINSLVCSNSDMSRPIQRPQKRHTPIHSSCLTKFSEDYKSKNLASNQDYLRCDEPLDNIKHESGHMMGNVPSMIVISTTSSTHNHSNCHGMTQASYFDKRQNSQVQTLDKSFPRLDDSADSNKDNDRGVRKLNKKNMKFNTRSTMIRDSDESVTQDDGFKIIWEDKIKHLLKILPVGVDEGAAKQILNEIVIKSHQVHWDDIAGLDAAKTALKEAVVYPFIRPDLFMGLREPARGMLLFGPAGTGKTMLARAVATESRSTFFSISASSLTSKFLGESEKLVKALFKLAKALAPSIIFVDEIDSLLSTRSGSGEQESTGRIKTEFLIQWSDLQQAAVGQSQKLNDKDRKIADQVLVLAATNLPWAIDEAARRRFVRRQYIPLPERKTRRTQLKNLLCYQTHELQEDEILKLVDLTEGFSGSDITALAKDAAMGPLRSLGEALLFTATDAIRPINFADFEASLINIKPSVSVENLKAFEDWSKIFGERGG